MKSLLAFITILMLLSASVFGQGEVYHPAEEIREGTFDGSTSGWYNFPGNINLQSYLLISSYLGTYGTGYGRIFYDGAGGLGDSTGYLALGTNGNNRLYITNTGRIGIGVSSPSRALDINGNLRIRSLANCDTIDTDANGNLICGTDTVTDSDWTINGNDMYSGVSGNVGIGTSTPSVKLEIDSSSSTQALRIRGANVVTDIADIYVAADGRLILSSKAGSNIGGYFDFQSEDDNYGIIIRESNGTGTTTFANLYVTDTSDDWLGIQVNGNNQKSTLVVTASDRVGIGTSTPSTDLDVAGDVRVRNLTSCDTVETDSNGNLGCASFNCVTKSLSGNGNTRVYCDAGYTMTGGGCYFRKDSTNNIFRWCKPIGNGWEVDTYLYLEPNTVYVRCCRIS